MKYRHRVLGMLFLLSVITYLDRVCIAVAGPRMQADLQIGPEWWGWVVGVFAISYAAFEIPSGSMGDRMGPRKVLTRIVLWWSAFTTLTGFAANFQLLLPIRFLFGAGEAGAYPNSSSSISRWFPTVERARAHGIVWMASRIGGAISPLLVVPIQARYECRASASPRWKRSAIPLPVLIKACRGERPSAAAIFKCCCGCISRTITAPS